MSAAIVAFGAVSGMGEGAHAVSAGVVGERARVVIGRDEELMAAGLARPFAARVALPDEPGDRATRILLRAMRGCATELDAVLPGWRKLRIGLALGTSSGGMRSFEQFSRSGARELAAKTLYFAPLLDVIEALDLEVAPATLVMGACAASTLAIGLGRGWLAAGACDLVLAGGFDAVSTLVASGFEVLRATSAEVPPRPFRAARDGMALGEGAAVVALRSSEHARDARVHVTGFGASCDAVHLTAPDRSGRGLAAAATRALREAGVTEVDLVSPHGSATLFSDAAEARALATSLGELSKTVVVHPFKAQVGHTLGASGVLETLACVDALARGVYPAAAGEGSLDPDAPATLLAETRAGSPATALKLSAAFGGANAALVLSRTAGPPRATPATRKVYVRSAVQVVEPPVPATLAAHIGWPVERVLRADPLTRWVLASVAALVARDGPLTGSGIVVGTTFATLETDASFFGRIEERGVRMAEPRKFPYTSPNACGGDAGVAFGLTGPGFSVGSGEHSGLEALVIATHLVAAGDAESILVVAVDDAGPAVSAIAGHLGIRATSGAIALLVSASPVGAVAEVTRAQCGIGPAPRPVGTTGHEALLPLVAASPRELAKLPSVLEGGSPAWERAVGWARVELQAIVPGIDAGEVAP